MCLLRFRTGRNHRSVKLAEKTNQLMSVAMLCVELAVVRVVMAVS